MNSLQESFGPGTVYTETIVHAPAEQFTADAPYQIAIVSLDSGGRITARIEGVPVSIGDKVDFIELRNQIPFFQRGR